MIVMVRDEIRLYLRAGVRGTFEILIDRVFQELIMLAKMKQISYYPPFPALLLDVDIYKCDSEEFVRAAETSVFDHSFSKYSDHEYVRDVVDPRDKTKTKKLQGFVYRDGDACLVQGMKTFMMNSISAQLNRDYVIQFMQSAGFQDVTVERRTNVHNGRKNVWMVRGVKF
jgi:hypothetical protein